jgi:F-type H+-transporting ATPase subunit gamma
MANFREYNRKIVGLRNMQRVTRTMKMVAATKLRRAQDARKKAADYTAHLGKLISRLAGVIDASAYPLMCLRAPVRRVLLLVVTSDKGLCGGFNHRLTRYVEEWIEENKGRYRRIRASFCGRRGYDFFKDKVEVRQFYETAVAHLDFVTASAIGNEMKRVFLSGRYDEVYLAYNEFKSPLSQKPVVDKLLPLAAERIRGEKAGPPGQYLFEPEEPELIGLLLAKVVVFRVYHALLESAAGEHGARMTAMDNATTNIDKLIERYTLLRNQARQASITKELIEVISGAEALK